jgi:uncharacterized protein YndB with AHSA1/START domain
MRRQIREIPLDRGTYITYDGRPAVRFERSYPYPVERVWDAVTRPEELAQWFPSTVSIEPRQGGTIRFSGDPDLDGTTGTVLAFDPPQRLGFTWGGDELHFALAATDDAGCSLTLINVLEARDAAARNAAGWSVCLAQLTTLLATGASAGPHSDAGGSWRSYYDEYLAAGLPAGALIPGEA